MVKKSVKAEVNNFVKGFVTEASPLNFPPNATIEEENFELNRDGSRDRRLGLGFETGYMEHTPATTSSVFLSSPSTSFEWSSVAGNANTSFLVVQFGWSLTFFDLNTSSVSANKVGEVILTGLSSDGLEHSLTSVEGRLIVVAGTGPIAVVEYKDGAFVVDYVRLKVRDVWGVTDIATDDDPTLQPIIDSSYHRYNLYNQGWAIPRRDDPNNADSFVDPTPYYFGTYGKYPSNSETVWAALQFTAKPHPDPGYECLASSLWKEVMGIALPAAKGYFIIDLLTRGTSRAERITTHASRFPESTFTSFGANQDYNAGGSSQVCEFAGRVFYGGFSGAVQDGDSRSPDLSGLVFFSQLIRNRKDITRCYQEGDPTSREGTDVVETDGGFIRISGANSIIRMVNVGTHLAVFATNGVWMVSGGADYGFSTTNYKVSRITNFGAISSKSIVEDSGRIYFWSLDGIYILEKNQFGDYGVQNISQATIQTFYEEIPVAVRQQAFGIYDPIGKKVKWIYQEGDRFLENNYTKEVSLDLTLSAFNLTTFFNLYNPYTTIVGVFKSSPFVGSETEEPIVAGGVGVQAGSLGQVVLTQTGRSSGVQAIRYICRIAYPSQYTYTFGYCNNSEFKDWEEVDGVGRDARAYMITGHVTAGDSSVAKQVPYLTMHFKRTEDGVDGFMQPTHQSGCLVQSQWDWANKYKSNKFGSQFQAYRYRKAYIATDVYDPYDSGFEVVTSKNKVRGRGKAFCMRIESEPAKDCRILGWSISLNGNQTT